MTIQDDDITERFSGCRKQLTKLRSELQAYFPTDRVDSFEYDEASRVHAHATCGNAFPTPGAIENFARAERKKKKKRIHHKFVQFVQYGFTAEESCFPFSRAECGTIWSFPRGKSSLDTNVPLLTVPFSRIADIRDVCTSR